MVMFSDSKKFDSNIRTYTACTATFMVMRAIFNYSYSRYLRAKRASHQQSNILCGIIGNCKALLCAFESFEKRIESLEQRIQSLEKAHIEGPDIIITKQPCDHEVCSYNEYMIEFDGIIV